MDNRYYIGFAVPAAVATEIAKAYPVQLRRESVVSGIVEDWTPAEALHCTLMFVGEVGDVPTLTAQMRPLAANFSRPQLTFTGPTVLLNGHLVIPVGGADRIADAFIRELGHLSEDRGVGVRPYFGHVTIARTRDPTAAAHLTSRFVQHSWCADRVDLVRSNGRRANPRYSIAAEVPLGR